MMSVSKRGRLVLFFLVCAILFTRDVFAADRERTQVSHVSLASGFDYSSGEYGTSDSTDILYIPLTGTYETGPWIFNLTVPYINITGTGNVSRGIGRYKSVLVTSTRRTTESGLGDVIAAATYKAFVSRDANPWFVDLTGNVKFGTADETKNLGTGENDYALQVDVYKIIDKITAFGTLGSKVLGSPANVSLDNVIYGSLGGRYMFTQQTGGSLILELSQKASAMASEQSKLIALFSYKTDELWSSQAYAAKGFSDGSPDWSIGAMLTYNF